MTSVNLYLYLYEMFELFQSSQGKMQTKFVKIGQTDIHFIASNFHYKHNLLILIKSMSHKLGAHNPLKEI